MGPLEILYFLDYGTVLDFSFLLIQSEISKSSGVPMWTPSFLHVIGLRIKMAETAVQDTLLKLIFRVLNITIKYVVHSIITTKKEYYCFKIIYYV